MSKGVRLVTDTSDIDRAFEKLANSRIHEKQEAAGRFRQKAASFEKNVCETLSLLAMAAEHSTTDTLREYEMMDDVASCKSMNVKNFLRKIHDEEMPVIGFVLTFTDGSPYRLFFQLCPDFSGGHPFTERSIFYPRRCRESEESVAIGSSAVFGYGNSQMGVIRACADASRAEVANAVKRAVEIHVKGIQTEDYLRQALRLIQKMGYLTDPLRRTGKTSPRYRLEDYFQRSPWEDIHGSDYMVPFNGTDGQYYEMKLQVKSAAADLEEHAQRHACIAGITSPKKLFGQRIAPMEKISVLKEMTLLAMNAHAHGVVLQLSDDPVAKAIVRLKEEGIIGDARRDIGECRIDAHRHHQKYLRYTVWLPGFEGSVRFAVFAEEWKRRYETFRRDHPSANAVLIRGLRDEEAIVEDLHRQILGILPREIHQAMPQAACPIALK